MATRVLTCKALNRALLARQLLLKREKMTVSRALEALVGMQAQVPQPPFIGLWTRLEKSEPERLKKLLKTRKAVRSTLMRATLHLMTAKDFVRLRPTLQPALTRGMASVLRKRADGLDVDALCGIGRDFFEQAPRPFKAFRDHLAVRFPKGDARAMAYIVRTHLPLVQVPTEDAWGFPATADFAVADTWLGKSVPATGDAQLLVRRYLSAFGPATPADAQTWSGLPGLSEVFEALRSKLKVFRDEQGRELFDLAAAPRPSASTRAPVRFVPAFDNLVLSHADRARIISEAHRPKLVTKNLQVHATFLVDGFVAGTWKIERKKRSAALMFRPFEGISRVTRSELTAEGEKLLAFAAGDAENRGIDFEPA